MSLSVSIETIGGPVEPVGNARARWTRREGLLLRLVDADGRVGLGEASPLPGHSPDSLDEAFETLERAARAHAIELFEAARSLDGLSTLLDELDVRSPSARFALETAALDLRARREGRPLHRLLSGATSSAIALSALVELETEEATRTSARRLLASGYRCFKVIGNMNAPSPPKKI